MLGLIACTTWSNCRSVTVVSPAKTTQPIEMPFGLRTRVGPKNHKLEVSCAKTAESIEILFDVWTRVDSEKHVFDGAQIPP